MNRPGRARPPEPGPRPDEPPRWQRSSFSGSGGGTECLEAAATRDGRLCLRESERPATVLTLAPGPWAAFLRAVRAGAGGVGQVPPARSGRDG